MRDVSTGCHWKLGRVVIIGCIRDEIIKWRHSSIYNRIPPLSDTVPLTEWTLLLQLCITCALPNPLEKCIFYSSQLHSPTSHGERIITAQSSLCCVAWIEDSHGSGWHERNWFDSNKCSRCGRYSTGIATTRNLVIVWFAVHRLLGCSVVVEISGITVNSGDDARRSRTYKSDC